MNNQTLKSVFILALSSVLGYFVSLYLTSYVTEKIGIEAYGFVSLAKTFASYGNIITVALTSFMVRFISVHYHRGEVQESLSYYASSVGASVALCALLSVVFFAIVLNLEYVIRIPDQLVKTVKILFFTVFVGFIATTLSTPFSIGFYIKNRLDLSGVVKSLSYVFEAAALIVLFKLFGASLWFVGIGILTAAVTVLSGSAIFNRRLVPDLKYNRHYFSISKVKTLLGNGMWNSVNQLGNTLNSGLDLLVSNALLSGVQTGQIAVAKNIGIMFATLAGIVFQPLQPELIRSYSNGTTEEFLDRLSKSMKFCGFFGSVAFAGFVALGNPFYQLFLPSQNTNLLCVLTILTIFTYILDIFLQPIYYVSTLTVKNKIPCFVTIAGGLLNVAGMFLLIRYTSMGVYSVPVTTAVIMFAINMFFNPTYASMCLKIRRNYFYPLIVRHLLATAIMCLVFYVICIFIQPAGWIGFLLTALLLAALGAFVYAAFMLNKKEKTVMMCKFLGFLKIMKP